MAYRLYSRRNMNSRRVDIALQTSSDQTSNLVEDTGAIYNRLILTLARGLSLSRMTGLRIPAGFILSSILLSAEICQSTD